MKKKMIYEALFTFHLENNASVIDWWTSLDSIEDRYDNCRVNIIQNPNDYTIELWGNRLETAEEFEKRKKIKESCDKIFRKERFEKYLELKKEFETEQVARPTKTTKLLKSVKDVYEKKN